MEIPRLHPDTIEEVKQRVDIVDVISEYVVLRKRGKDYLGLCPFHQEKTPSFSVSPSKQLYYCFGCNAGGSAIKFVMELEKRSFSEVVLDLARRYQIPLKTLEPKQRQELQRQLSLKEQLYEILAVATSFYQHALRQPQGEKALNYLKLERKLREETIQQFRLGYAPGGWETLYHYLVEQKCYPLALVEEAGLIKQRQSGSGYYDQFRDRLMIPISDAQGRIIAFGSRTLTDEQPKYLNSPDTPLFDKSKTLFALDQARQQINKLDQAIVVEGYFDAIALHGVGINNVVASLGTAFTQNQLKLLLRYLESKQVILNFDADTAGNNATQRAITEIENLIYAGQVQLKVLNLPDGKDADEFLRSDTNAVQIYHNCIQTAPLWLDWQIQQLLIGQNLKQADQFQKIAQAMVKLLQKIEDRNQRTHYLSYCAQILSQGESKLIPLYANTLNKQLKNRLRLPNAQVSVTDTPINSDLDFNSDSNLLKNAESILLLIYLHCPQFRSEILTDLEAKDLLFSFSNHRYLWQKILTIEATNLEQNQQLLSLLQEQIINFSELKHLLYPGEVSKEIIKRPSFHIRSALAVIERVSLDKYARYCLEKIHNLDPSKNIELGIYYQQELKQTKQKIYQLEQERILNYLDLI